MTLIPLTEIEKNAGHVLAVAGSTVLGRAGFIAVSVAALLATASAVNATIFAASSIGEDAARKRELFPVLMQRAFGGKPLPLLISAALVILLVLFFPLNAVGQMTSLAFLVIYGAVSLSHLRLRQQTGAKAWPLSAAVAINSLLFLALIGDAVRTGPASTWVTFLVSLAGSFIFEAWWRSTQRTSITPSG